jgi:hypothetical protein
VTRSFTVTKDGDRVLTFDDEPGPLMSSALPPPGFVPPTNPFLTAQTHNVFHEHDLRELLDASSGIEDFVARLEAAGYTVAEDGAG